MNKLAKILALPLALLMLAGCKDPKPSADPTNGSTEPEGHTVRVLSGVSYVSDDREIPCTVTFNQEGVTLAQDNDGAVYVEVKDFKGNALMVKQTGKNGELYISLKHEYDEKGNRSALFSYNKEGTVDFSTTYTYNDQNLKIRQESCNSEGLVNSVNEYTYHENGKIKEERYYDNNGALTQCYVYTQDEQGRTIRCDRTDLTEAYYTYTYDEQGRMISAVWTHGENDVDNIDCFYTYDEQGRIIQYREETDTFVMANSTYTYDEDGYLIGISDIVTGDIRLQYEERALSEELAADVEAWSKDGVIANFCRYPGEKL